MLGHYLLSIYFEIRYYLFTYKDSMLHFEGIWDLYNPLYLLGMAGGGGGCGVGFYAFKV